MKKQIALALMLSMLTPVGVMAQDSGTDTTGAASSTTEPTATTGTSGTFLTMPDASSWRMSALEQADVYSSEGEKIGKITDIMLNQSGNVSAVLIGVGEFLGTGTKDVAVSMTALTFQPAAGMASGATPDDSTLTTGSTTPDTTGTTAGSTATTEDTQTAASGTTPSTTASSMAPERIVLNVTRAELESAPAFDMGATTGQQ